MAERNDPCPCGSGKKYKKCCINKEISTPFDIWKQRAFQISTDVKHPEPLVDSFFAVFNHSIKKNWRGACHAISGILYVLLREQGIHAQLKVGFVKSPKVHFEFSHSWVEVDEKVYDLGLYRSNPPVASPNEYQELSAPIFHNIDLEANMETSIRYGVPSVREKTDRNLQTILNMTLGDYMNGWPNHKNGLWGEVIEIADRLGLSLNLHEIKEKYTNEQFSFNS